MDVYGLKTRIAAKYAKSAAAGLQKVDNRSILILGFARVSLRAVSLHAEPRVHAPVFMPILGGHKTRPCTRVDFLDKFLVS